MATFRINLTKEITVSYEVTANTDDVAVVEQLESEKLSRSEYEESLNLDWNFGFMPEVTSVHTISSDQTEFGLPDGPK